jgi:hypothetical protein
MPVGTFVSGSADIYVVSHSAGSGNPGLIVRLYTNSDLTTYADARPVASSSIVGSWQRITFTARTGTSERIYAIRIYLMGNFNGTGLGPWTGSVIFDNLRFALFDSSVDNTTITIASNGSLSGAGGGQVTITGLGYSGDLNATDNSSWASPNDVSQIDMDAIDGRTVLSVLEGGVVQVGDSNIILDSEDLGTSQGRIIIAPNGGITNNHYALLESGDIKFYYWDGTKHVSYKSMTRVETGVATNGVVTELPGYWKNQPKVMISPYILQTFNANYATVNQQLALAVEDLEEFNPSTGIQEDGTHIWRFTPTAMLTASADAGTEVVNDVDSDSWDTAGWDEFCDSSDCIDSGVGDITGSTYSLLTNTTNLTVYGSSQLSRLEYLYNGIGDFYFQRLYGIKYRYIKLYVELNDSGTFTKVDELYQYTSSSSNPDNYLDFTLSYTATGTDTITRFYVMLDAYETYNDQDHYASNNPPIDAYSHFYANLKVDSYGTQQSGYVALADGSLRYIAVGD